MPVTTPDPLTVAILPLAEVQIPPGVVSDNAVVEPTQVVKVPVMGAGTGFTVSTEVVIQPTAEV